MSGSYFHLMLVHKAKKSFRLGFITFCEVYPLSFLHMKRKIRHFLIQFMSEKLYGDKWEI